MTLLIIRKIQFKTTHTRKMTAQKEHKTPQELAEELISMADAKDKNFVNLWFEVLEAAFRTESSHKFGNLMKSSMLMQSLYVKFMQENWYSYFSGWQKNNSKK